MHHLTRTVWIATMLLLPVRPLHAQAAADPSGHWEGTIQAPNLELKIEFDLARNSAGKLAGTFSYPAEHLKGFPLADVAVDGRSVRLLLKANAGGTFDGVLAADGQWISGEFITTAGGFAVPFSLRRLGDVTIEPPAKSAPVTREFEGTWKGTLDVSGKPLRLVLTMTNQSDGTATGTIVSLDQGELQIPVAIVQAASSLTLDLRSIGSSYSGALSADGSELIGVYAEGSFTAPLTFRIARPRP